VALSSHSPPLTVPASHISPDHTLWRVSPHIRRVSGITVLGSRLVQCVGIDHDTAVGSLSDRP